MHPDLGSNRASAGSGVRLRAGPGPNLGGARRQLPGVPSATPLLPGPRGSHAGCAPTSSPEGVSRIRGSAGLGPAKPRGERAGSSRGVLPRHPLMPGPRGTHAGCVPTPSPAGVSRIRGSAGPGPGKPRKDRDSPDRPEEGVTNWLPPDLNPAGRQRSWGQARRCLAQPRRANHGGHGVLAEVAGHVPNPGGPPKSCAQALSRREHLGPGSRAQALSRRGHLAASNHAGGRGTGGRRSWPSLPLLETGT